MNVNGISGGNAFASNITMSSRVRELVREKQAQAPRTAEPEWFARRRTIDDIDAGSLREYDPDNWILERIDTALANYSSLTDDDIRSLAVLASRFISCVDASGGLVPENRRGFSDMVSFMEEKLANINSNFRFSTERRAIEQRIWEEGFYHALSSLMSGSQNITIADAERMIQEGRHNAENNVEDAKAFALDVIQNVASFTSNTRLQELIVAGMDSLVMREIDINSQLLTFFDASGKSDSELATRADETRREADEFRTRMRDSFEQSRGDIIQASGLRINTLQFNLSMFARFDTFL